MSDIVRAGYIIALKNAFASDGDHFRSSYIQRVTFLSPLEISCAFIARVYTSCSKADNGESHVDEELLRTVRLNKIIDSGIIKYKIINQIKMINQTVMLRFLND